MAIAEGRDTMQAAERAHGRHSAVRWLTGPRRLLLWLTMTAWPSLPLLSLAAAPEAVPPEPPQSVESPLAAEELEAGNGGPRLLPLPFLFYMPETKMGFGGLVQFIFDQDGTGPSPWTSRMTPLIIYTQRKQLTAVLGIELYGAEGSWRLKGAGVYSRFPDTFWGIGNDAPGEAEEDFTPRSLLLDLTWQRRLAGPWYLGPSLLVARRELVETEPEGLLARGEVPGTETSRVVGTGLVLTRDTRDDSIYPRQGGWDRLYLRVHDGALGSDHEYSQAEADLRRYYGLDGGRVLALQVTGVISTSTPPFDLLPGIGGDSLLRGYYQGRYRDRHLLAAQAELRSRLWRRLGLAAFCGAGQVAASLDGFGLSRMHPAAGLGLRFMISRQDQTNLRADWGFAEDAGGFYLGMGEAF